MTELEKYLKDPCGTSALPWWKEKNFMAGEHMKVVHDHEFCKTELRLYTDERYFRLIHHLKQIPEHTMSDFEPVTAEPEQTGTFVNLINQSYDDIHVGHQQIEGYQRTKVYDPLLWILIRERRTGEYVGCGIADFDREIGEGILEWIQALPRYRKKGIGQYFQPGGPLPKVWFYRK